MAEDSYWISAGKLTLIERVAMLVFGVATFYMLVRVLNKSDYGTWMFFVSIYAFMDTARSGFFKNPLIRYFNKVKEGERASLQGTSLLLNLIFSLLFSLALWVAAMPIANSYDMPTLPGLLFINIFISLAMAFFGHLEYIQAARFNFLGPLIGNIIRSGLLCAFVGWYFWKDMQLDLGLLAIGFLLSNVIAVFVMLFHARKAFSKRLDLKLGWARELFGYGKYTLGTNLSAVFMRNIDTWMLGWYISPAAIGIYNVAIRIANLFEVPTMALAQVMFPQAVKKAETEGSGALKDLYEKSVSILVVLLLPLVAGVIIFSDTIVEIIAGPDYAEAGMILNITMLYGLIVPFNKQLGILLDAIGKAKTNMLFVARNALINLILNALMIPQFGIIGAAYATLTTFVVVMIINQVYLQRNFQVTFSAMFKHMRYYAIQVPSAVKRKLLG